MSQWAHPLDQLYREKIDKARLNELANTLSDASDLATNDMNAETNIFVRLVNRYLGASFKC